MKRSLALLLGFLMVFSLFPSIALAEDTGLTVTGDEGTPLTATDNVYTISEDVTISGETTVERIVVKDNAVIKITLNGVSIDLSSFTRDAVGNGESPITLGDGSKVTLQLADGTTNTLCGGPGYPGLRTVATSELTIQGSGSLTVYGGELVSAVTQVGGVYGVGSPAAIGSMQDQGFGTINIHSGTITATGKSGTGAGIGGGWGSTGGTIKITGGTVKASGGPNNGQGAAGIGSGFHGQVDSITITGGTIEATGSNMGAGIGLGGSSRGLTEDRYSIKITGGNITAKTGIGAGIGSGNAGYGGDITIEGGNITAEATGTAGAGIGGASGCVVNIKGGTVTATGSERGSGIGGIHDNYDPHGCTVNISGGKVTAQGHTGIGGGYGGNGGQLTVSGGTVTAIANSTYYGAAIGGGYNGSGGDVIITGGTVKTQNGNRSIGGGRESSDNGTLTNGSAPVYLTEISLKDWDDNAVTGEKAVSQLTASLAGSAYAYKITDVYTDADAKLYFYLPEGTTVTELVTTADRYTGIIVTGAQDTSGVLKPQSKPIFGTDPLPDAIVGESYSVLIPCDGTQPITFSLGDGSALPDGLTLNENTGEIFGTPKAVGSYTFTIVAANGVGTSSQDFSLEVVLSPLAILEYEYRAAAGVPLDDMKIQVNRDSVTVELTDEGLPPGFEMSLPPGVVLNSDGSFTGTPTHTGAYIFGVKISDGVDTISEFIMFAVSPTVTTKSLPAGTVGVPYSFTLTADGNLQNPFWYLYEDDSTLPKGLNFDEETGVISGTPEETGEFTLWVCAGDYVKVFDGYYEELYSDDVELTLTIGTPEAPAAYTIEAAPNNPAYGTVEGAGSYEADAEVTLKAIPKDGYRFVRWLEGSAAVSTSAEYRFTASGNRTLQAEFAPIAAPAVKAATAGYDVIQLSWNAVDGANAYEVYRATNSNGTYSKIATTTALNYTDTGLTAGTTYYYKVRVKCAAGSTTTYGAYSAEVSAQPVMLAPASLTAVPASFDRITLTWAAVSGATSYEVYRATAQNSSYSKVADVSSTSYTNTGLTVGTTYYYMVRACRTVGGANIYSDFSAVASAQPALLAPASLSATATSCNSIRLTWAGVSGATKYEVYRSTAQNGSYSKVAETSSTSFNNTKLTTGMTYYYKVRAYRTVGKTKIYSDYSAVASAQPVLSSPASFRVRSVSYDNAKLTWGAVSGRTKYEVYRSTEQNGNYTKVAETSSTSYTVKGLMPGTTYYYKVRAYRTVGKTRVYGDYSSVAVVTTPAISSPASIKVSSVTYDNARLTWSAVAGRTKYEVYRSTEQNGTYTKVAETSSTSYRIKGLMPGTTYYYKVRAYRTVSKTRVYGDYSPVAAVTTPAILSPASVKVSSVTYDKAKLTWSAVAGRTKYEIYRSTEQNGTYTKVAETTSTSYTVKGLMPGMTYYYKVRAYRTVSKTRVYGDYSPVAVVTTPAILSPVSLNAVPASFNSVKLTWGAVAGRTKYEVYRSTEQNGTYTKVGETSFTHFTDKKAAPGTTYYYKVRAYRTVNKTKVYGNFSAMASAAPELSTPKVKASALTASINVSWSAVSGATKYEVYRAASSDGAYEKVAETSARSFKDSGLTKDQTYYYKVRAYRQEGSTRVYGPYSSVVSAKVR